MLIPVTSPSREPTPGEHWRNMHTGQIAIIVRVDDYQARPRVTHRVVVYTDSGSVEEKRCNLHSYKREYVSRGLVEMFGPEDAAQVGQGDLAGIDR